MRNEFSTLDIVKALEIPRERLREWINRNYVTPSVPAKGQGRKAILTRQDVYTIQVFRVLVDFGVDRSTAGNLARYYQLEMKTSKKKPSYMLFRLGDDQRNASEISETIWAGFAGNGEKVELDEGAPENESRMRNKNWWAMHTLNLNTLHKQTDAALNTL